ncbi:MAG: formate/nitrite transporter family protein [Candidatus Heimdallarchaeaceae archaeon]
MSESKSKIVEVIDKIGQAKCCMSLRNIMILSVLAGVYIGFGGVLSIIVTHDMPANFGVGFTKLIAGISFSVGLMLVVLGGAELFTGNNLLIIPCLDRRISPFHLIKNLSVVYVGNFVGSLLLVVIFVGTGIWKNNNYLVGASSLIIASNKVNLTFLEAFSRGILCNWLVCLAIWIATSARSTIGKIFSVLFPIMAFVSSGFEHSIANMFFIPLGLLLKNYDSIVSAAGSPDLSSLTWGNFFYGNLLPVTLGNILGGLIFVGFLYWFVYRTKDTICGSSGIQDNEEDLPSAKNKSQSIPNHISIKVHNNVKKHKKSIKYEKKK